MLYLDCTKYLDTHDITMDELLKKGVHYGVCWQDGRPFMNPNTIRMNLALPTSLVEEAFSRLKELLDKNNILDYRVKSNDGWNFYAVFLYSDGTMRIGSGDKAGFDDYNDRTFEKHATYWKNKNNVSNIEK